MIKFISAISMVLLLSFTPNSVGQDKEYVAKLTLNDWNILIASVNSPDDVSVNQKKAVIAKLVAQLQPQVASDTIPKKK